MGIADNFEHFFNTVSSWKQPAKKGYRMENVKHISLKLIDFCTAGRGRAVVFGDKDADGVFSSMIMATYLRRLMQIYQEKRFLDNEIGVDIRYSDRERDGFGLSRERYDELSEKYDLIITTDNGTSADFHAFSIGNLIVTDHHPLNEGESVPEVPYILNPNVWRKDGQEYSTSGGMVAYDIVKFIDRVLREQEKHYREYLKDPQNYTNHERMFEVLKEFAAFTIISDMAKLDANNRRFVIEAFATAKQKSDAVPLYGFFKNDFSQNSLSFNINPKINIDRMGMLNTINPDTGKTYMESFIAPKTFAEFKSAKTFIEKVDKQRKAITTRERNRIFDEVDTQAGIITALCSAEDVRIGLGGLIANSLSRKFGKPAIIAVPTRDRTRLSFSGRGDNVKELMGKVLPRTGGHRDAAGGSYPLQPNDSIEKVFADLERKFKALIVPPHTKKQIIHDPHAPLSVEEVWALGREYKRLAKGVETTEDMLVAVYGADIIGEIKNEWGTIALKGEDRQKRVEVLINKIATPLNELREAEIHLIALKANGTFSHEAYYPTIQSYLNDVAQNPKSEVFNIASEVYDLKVQTQNETNLNALISEKKIVADDLFGDIYYLPSDTLLNIGTVKEAIVLVPSYTEDRNPMRKREGVLEVFVGKDETTPFDTPDDFKRNIVDMLSVAGKRIKEGAEGVIVERSLFDTIGSDEKVLLQMVLKNLSANIQNAKNERVATQENRQGADNEQTHTPHHSGN